MTTNASFVKNVNRLIEVKKSSAQTLTDIIAEPIAACRGIGEANTPPNTSTSAGIASPLTEIPNTREYYEPTLIKSSDGLFVIESRPIKKAVFEDGNGKRITIDFLKE